MELEHSPSCIRYRMVNREEVSRRWHCAKEVENGKGERRGKGNKRTYAERGESL